MVDRGGRDVTRRGVSRERADLERAGVSRGVSARAEDVRTRRATLARLASARAPRERANPNDPRRMYLRPMVSSRDGKKPPFDRSRGRTFVADVLQQTLRRGVRRGVLHHEQNLRSGAGRRGKSKRRGVSRRSSTGLGASRGKETIALGPLANMQHRAPTFRSVSRECRAAATEKSPRAVLLTYPEPFREPRPRGLDQIWRARGRRGGRHRLARLHLGRYNHNTRRANLVARRRPPVPPRAIGVCAANSSQ